MNPHRTERAGSTPLAVWACRTCFLAAISYALTMNIVFIAEPYRSNLHFAAVTAQSFAMSLLLFGGVWAVWATAVYSIVKHIHLPVPFQSRHTLRFAVDTVVPSVVGTAWASIICIRLFYGTSMSSIFSYPASSFLEEAFRYLSIYIVSFGIQFISVLLLFFTWGRLAAKPEYGVCWKCGYAIEAMPRCPECGSCGQVTQRS